MQHIRMAERERNTFYGSHPLTACFIGCNVHLLVQIAHWPIARERLSAFRRYEDVSDDDSLKFEGSIRMEKEVALNDCECGRHAGSVLQRVGLHVVWCLCAAFNNFSFLPKWVWFQMVSAIF